MQVNRQHVKKKSWCQVRSKHSWKASALFPEHKLRDQPHFWVQASEVLIICETLWNIMSQQWLSRSSFYIQNSCLMPSFFSKILFSVEESFSSVPFSKLPIFCLILVLWKYFLHNSYTWFSWTKWQGTYLIAIRKFSQPLLWGAD